MVSSVGVSGEGKNRGVRYEGIRTTISLACNLLDLVLGQCVGIV